MAIITSFGAPTTLESLADYLENGKLPPIERIQLGSKSFGMWPVSESCAVGDTVFFHCSAAPVETLGLLCSQLDSMSDPGIITFIKREFILHKCYADAIVAVGEVACPPVKVSSDQEFEFVPGRWHASIANFHRLKNPISLSDLGDAFALSKTSSITELDAQQSTKALAAVMFGNLRG